MKSMIFKSLLTVLFLIASAAHAEGDGVGFNLDAISNDDELTQVSAEEMQAQQLQGLSTTTAAVTIDQLLNAISIDVDPRVDGNNLIAVRAREWSESGKSQNDAVRLQGVRANKFCQYFGYKNAASSKVQWRGSKQQVAVLTENGLVTETQQERVWRESRNKEHFYQFAVFTHIRCIK